MRATTVLFNGSIHTMDSATPRAQAIAIVGNRVLAVGGDSEMRALLDPEGNALNLDGRTVVPGFTDAHLHFMSYGLSLKQVDLAEVPTKTEALERVAVGVEATPAGHWAPWAGPAAPGCTGRPPPTPRRSPAPGSPIPSRTPRRTSYGSPRKTGGRPR